MIVRFTHRQFGLLEAVTAGDPRFEPWLSAAVSPKHHHGALEVALPATGWRHLIGLLEEMVIGPSGGHRADAKRHALTARRRIADRLSLLEIHPALKGQGIMIASDLVIPVWGFGIPWSIYPAQAPFLLMVPRRVEWGKARVTLWHAEMPSRPVGLLSEHEHLVFTTVAAPQDGSQVVGQV